MSGRNSSENTSTVHTLLINIAGLALFRKIAASVGLLFSTTVAAAPVRWELSELTFEDGATTTGAFWFDPDVGSNDWMGRTA